MLVFLVFVLLCGQAYGLCDDKDCRICLADSNCAFVEYFDKIAECLFRDSPVDAPFVMIVTKEKLCPAGGLKIKPIPYAVSTHSPTSLIIATPTIPSPTPKIIYAGFTSSQVFGIVAGAIIMLLVILAAVFFICKRYALYLRPWQAPYCHMI